MSTDAENALGINGTFGAILVGCFVACILYGITTLQAYCYFIFYPKDSLHSKLLVLGIWLLDSVHTGIITYGTYHYLIINNCERSQLPFTNWSIPSSIIINTIISCTVQAYFLRRIIYLTPQRLKWWIIFIIGTLVFAHFAFALETSILMLVRKEWSKLGSINYHAAAPFAISAVLSDIMIASSLIYFLHGQRSGIKKTDQVITKLIVYAANRGLLTSTVITIEAIMFMKFPGTFWFLAIDFIIGKLYANSFLATLNSRCFVGHFDSNRTIHTSIRFSTLTEVNSLSPVDDEDDRMESDKIKGTQKDSKARVDVSAGSGRAITIDIPLTFVSHRTKHPESDNRSPC